MPECLSFGLGDAAVDIVELIHQGIPQPDSWSYSGYSRVETCGDGTKKGFGFPVAEWTWDVLTQFHINKILGYFTGDEASATVYISTPTDRGGSAQIFDEFSCVMDRPTAGQSLTHIPRTQKPVVFSNVRLTFSRLVAT
jgi:hypothetical protein